MVNTLLLEKQAEYLQFFKDKLEQLEKVLYEKKQTL